MCSNQTRIQLSAHSEGAASPALTSPASQSQRVSRLRGSEGRVLRSFSGLISLLLLFRSVMLFSACFNTFSSF